MPKFIQEFFRLLGIVLAWPLQLLFFKRRTFYENPTTRSRHISGGALVVSNHFHVFDYMLSVFLFYGRKLHIVMIDRMYKKSKYFHVCMDVFGGICANRDDMGMRFADESVRVIEEGGLVQIFPEGHISPDGEMQPFKNAYLMIALRSDAPIIPVILDGNYGLFRRAGVIIGEPIYLSQMNKSLSPTKEELMEMNRAVERKCRQLREELRRRTARN